MTKLLNLQTSSSETPSRIESNTNLFGFELDSEDLNLIKSLDKRLRSCQFIPSVKSTNFPKSWLSEECFANCNK